MDLGLSDAVVVVAGGSKGMGRAAVDTFASEGARIGVLARGATDLDATIERAIELGAADAVPLQADLTSASAVTEAFSTVASRWGELNVLVNAAGPVDVGVGGFDDVDDDEWHATFDIGTISAVRCVRNALPLLRAAQWARIVNISAHSTKRQSAAIVAYTAAKAALTSLSKNLSLSLAPEGILVNTISPGSFASAGMRGYVAALPAERGADPDDLYDVMRVIAEDFGHPAHLGRAADPAEIGPVIAFAASKVNTYMTGANINVDGGSDFS